MTPQPISNHFELIQEIAQLKLDKLEKEAALKQSFNAVIDALDPVTIAKNSLSELVKDKDTQHDMTTGLLQWGSTVIINKVLGKYNSLKGFVASLVTAKVSDAVIKYNIPSLLMSTVKLFQNKSEKEKYQ